MNQNTMNTIPYGRQHVTDQDIKAVHAVLRSDWLTQGPAVPRFESAVAERAGARHGVAVNSATSALHVACMALGLGPGDLLWTSPNTFVASANCARYCGADVDFVDIDPRTYNMSAERLAEKLAVAKKSGRLPKIVVPVHFAGQSCDMRTIGGLAATYGFKVVEDASHAVGGAYMGRPVGDCRYSDIAVFSFHPVKIITTAEGGMAMTNDEELAERMRRLRSHGITRDPDRMINAPEGPWSYEQIELGFNYRMTDLQAALGLSQLERLDAYVAKRHEIAAAYDQALADLPLITPHQSPDARSAYHLYPIRIDPKASGRSRRDVFDFLREQGIGVNVHYIPVHTQPYYTRLGFKIGDFPEAERYYRDAISLPMFSTLSPEDRDRVVQALRKALT